MTFIFALVYVILGTAGACINPHHARILATLAFLGWLGLVGCKHFFDEAARIHKAKATTNNQNAILQTLAILTGLAGLVFTAIACASLFPK